MEKVIDDILVRPEHPGFKEGVERRMKKTQEATEGRYGQEK